MSNICQHMSSFNFFHLFHLPACEHVASQILILFKWKKDSLLIILFIGEIGQEPKYRIGLHLSQSTIRHEEKRPLPSSVSALLGAPAHLVPFEKH